MPDNPGELAEIEVDPEPYGDDDARADDQDALAEQTDNSGEDGEDAPQDPDAVKDVLTEFDDGEDDDGDQ